MAFLSPEYEFDVFVSYSHANDHDKWVTRFLEGLRNRLAEHPSKDIKIFYDARSLQGNHELTPELRRAVAASAVFLPIVSRSYMTSEWCRAECRTFLEANPNRRWAGRVFPVRYDNVSPAAYQALLEGDVLGYEFFGPTERGDAIAEFAPDSEEFRTRLLALREHVAEQLIRLKTAAVAPSATSMVGASAAVAPAVSNAEPSGAEPSGAEPSSEDADRPRVFVAETAPALNRLRDELVATLEGSRATVVRAGADFFEAAGFETRYDELLRQADVFVQLLGRTFLPHEDEDVQSWDRWQWRRATQVGVLQQRWFNKFDKDGRELDLARLDAAHRELVTLPETWDCDFQRFKQLVGDQAQRQFQQRRNQRRLAAADQQPLVVVRSDKADLQFADEVMAKLAELHCDVMRVPEREIKSLDDFAQRYSCDGLLVIYRACQGTWILDRVQELRKFLRRDQGRRWACGLWKQPLDDDDPLSCALNGLLVIDPRDEQTLHRFLRCIRRKGVEETAS